MAHNPEWHRAYSLLELAANIASEELRLARKALERKRPPAGAQARYDAALEASRAAGKKKWDFEMAGAVITDIATLPVDQWAQAMMPRHS